jgi:hypothetical protein
MIFAAKLFEELWQRRMHAFNFFAIKRSSIIYQNAIQNIDKNDLVTR